jgi:hypothetical protein
MVNPLLATILTGLALSVSTSAGPINVLYTIGGNGTDEFDSTFVTQHFYVTNNLVGYPLQNLYEFQVNDPVAASAIITTPANFVFVGDNQGSFTWIDQNPGDNLQLPGATIEFDVTVTASAYPFGIAVPSSLGMTAYTTDNGSTGSDYPYSLTPGTPSFFISTGIQGDMFGVPEPSTLLLLGAGLVGVAVMRRCRVDR